MTRSRQAEILAIIFVIAIYLFARFSGLTESCLWFDEIFSVHAATHQWRELVSFVAADLIHPPLFYILLKLWISIGGESVVWLRSLPVLISCLALIPFLLLLGELKVDRLARLVALLFFAVNGSLIKYSQEVRMYSLLMFLGLLSIWLTVRYAKNGKGKLPLLLVNLLLVYSHYFGWLIVGSGLIHLLIENRKLLRPIIYSVGIVFLGFVPWLILVITSAETGRGVSQNIGWMQRPGIVSLMQYVLAVIEPFYFSTSNVDAWSDYRVSIPIMVIIIASVCIFLFRWKYLDDSHRTITKALAILAGVPLIAAFLASWLTPHSVWGIRHLIITIPPLIMLGSVAVSKLPLPSLRTAALVLLILFSGYGAFRILDIERPQYSWCAWEQFAKELELNGQSSTQTELYVFEDLVGYHFWYALRDDNNIRVRVVKNIANMPEDKAYFLPRRFDGVDAVDEQNAFAGENFYGAFRVSENLVSRPAIFDLLEKRGFSVAKSTEQKIGGEREFLVHFVRSD